MACTIKIHWLQTIETMLASGGKKGIQWKERDSCTVEGKDVGPDFSRDGKQT